MSKQKECANRAALLAERYEGITGKYGTDKESLLTDMVADILYMAKELNLSTEMLLVRAIEYVKLGV